MKPSPSRCLSLLLLCGASSGHAQGLDAPPASPLAAVVTVDASHVVRRIPRTVFGTFLEPLGRSIYGGFWAEELENPGFEPNMWTPERIARMLERRPELRQSSNLGLPLPWQPLYADQANRYEPQARHAAGSQALLIMGLPGKETGIRQEVHLSVQRERRYVGSLYALHESGPAQLEVSLRRRDHPEEILARAAIALKPGGWARYPFALEAPDGKLQRLEPADFVVSLRNEARAAVDQVSLVPADAVKGMDPDMIALLQGMKTTVIRYGGNFTSGYHWQDGVGPMNQRPTLLNQSWGMPEYNTFGTDEFLTLCRLAGAQPQIALNLGSGTPQEAAAWVRYVDMRWGNKQGGLLWELGNELWGNGWQIGYPTQERIAARTQSVIAAVRPADPHARLIATGGDPDWFHDWNAQQLSLPPGGFQYLSTHFVDNTDQTVAPNPTPEFMAASAFALPVGLETDLRHAADQIAASPHKGRVQIAFSEWLYAGPGDRAPSFSNMGGAICAAGTLNTILRNTDVVPVSTMTGIGYFHGMAKDRGQVYGTPSYWAFRLYANADATRLVTASTTVDTYDVKDGNRRIPNIAAVPYLDVDAALNDAGDTLTLFCVNRHQTRAITARLQTGNFIAGTARVLRADSLYAENNADHPNAIHPTEAALETADGGPAFTFPPASVTIVTLKRG